MCREITTTGNLWKGFKIKPKDPRHFNPKSQKKQINVWIGMSIADLASSMDRTIDHVFDCLLHTEYADLYESPDETIEDMKLIVRIAQLSGMRCNVVARPSKVSMADMLNNRDRDAYPRPPIDKALMKPRSPVVTIMGHVDHGKTTLLDSLRHSRIVDQEFGAITQHIGAFVVFSKLCVDHTCVLLKFCLVKLPNSNSVITFLDTPGHAAFKKMRARGAKTTDIVVLVVAADDGVMDQTIESIRFAKQADVPFVVAINKCDKANLQIEQTKRQLLEHNVILEEFGGDVQAVHISALKQTNLNALNDAILAQAAVMDLKADFSGLAEGVIIESKSVPGKG
ncbi:unnamed protein product [Soboliphyme baturini]|uniref:Tr-type G domain-containing protein n=1 Tax=Soboliphyme baturini TaxID=241478 RepID=A0A183IVI3_9BILA|nr:unnamed protein product [Soboliphyme baturini]